MDEAKMNICKQTSKEISINGTALSEEAKAHVAACARCAASFREAEVLENCLLTVNEPEAPRNLMSAILEAVENRRSHRYFSPFLGFALKTAGILFLVISGVWLGLQAANGGNTPAAAGNEIDFIKTAPYRLNTEPLSPGSLAGIYFTILEESANAN
jgi:hypothetical protein